MCSVLFSGIFPEYQLRTSEPKWQWIRAKIFNEERQRLDYVIIGSSMARSAIKPQQLSEELGEKKIWNFAINWFGRDADYIIAKNLLEHHEVEHLLVEMREYPSNNSNHYVKYVVTPEEVWDEVLFFARHVRSKAMMYQLKAMIDEIADLFVRFSRLGIQKMLGGFQVNHEQLATYNDTGGYFTYDSIRKQKPDFFRDYKDAVTGFPVKKGNASVFHNSREEMYLLKMKQLTEQHDVKLSFVYLPTYLSKLPSEEQFDYFSGMGDIYLPNLEKLYKIHYWFDNVHLYHEGSIVYTEQLGALLKEGKHASPHYSLYE